MTRIRWRLVAVAILLLVVVSLPACLAWFCFWHYPQELNEGVTFRLGEVHTSEFTVRVTGTHYFQIEFDEQARTRRLECLIGVELCPEARSLLNVPWALRSGTRVVESGIADVGLRARFTRPPARWMRTFEARTGERYVLAMRFDVVPDELNAAHPRVVVRSQEYARSGWQLDVFIALAWVTFFGIPIALLIAWERANPHVPRG